MTEPAETVALDRLEDLPPHFREVLLLAAKERKLWRTLRNFPDTAFPAVFVLDVTSLHRDATTSSGFRRGSVDPAGKRAVQVVVADLHRMRAEVEASRIPTERVRGELLDAYRRALTSGQRKGRALAIVTDATDAWVVEVFDPARPA